MTPGKPSNEATRELKKRCLHLDLNNNRSLSQIELPKTLLMALPKEQSPEIELRAQTNGHPQNPNGQAKAASAEVIQDRSNLQHNDQFHINTFKNSQSLHTLFLAMKATSKSQYTLRILRIVVHPRLLDYTNRFFQSKTIRGII